MGERLEFAGLWGGWGVLDSPLSLYFLFFFLISCGVGGTLLSLISLPESLGNLRNLLVGWHEIITQKHHSRLVKKLVESALAGYS